MAQDFKFDPAKGKAIPTYIAQITVMKGKVQKMSKGSTSDVQPGERFNKGDSIITNEKSFVKLLVVDDTILSLGPKSEINFEDFDFTEKTDRKIVYNFIKGQLTGHVKNKAKENDIVVKTKMASMGIRGTQILVNHESRGKVDISEFALLTGSAEVVDGKSTKYPLKKGDRVVFVQDNTNNKGASEQGSIPRERFNELNREDIDEEKDFRPFMKYFEPTDVAAESAIQPFFHSEPEFVSEVTAERSANSGAKKTDEKPGLKQNLKKLNEKLREYQKHK